MRANLVARTGRSLWIVLLAAYFFVPLVALAIFSLWAGGNRYDFTAYATGPSSRLMFSAFGTSDSLGGYLDNVSVTAVPEPGSLQIFGLGLVILATIAGTRRRKSSVPSTAF